MPPNVPTPYRISSAHDDWMVPWFRRFEIEDGTDKTSVLERLSQFGLTGEDLRSLGISDPILMSADQYAMSMWFTMKRHYETAIVSVFARWGNDLIVPGRTDKMRFISLVLDQYRNTGVPIILSAEDLSADGPKMLLELEGADVIDEVTDVDDLFQLGIRCIAPEYNRSNLVADERGLTPLGRSVIGRMFEKGMIVDLAHSFPTVRSDILELAERTGNGHRIFYTHGGTTESILCDETEFRCAAKRGLTPLEIERILTLGGLVAFSPTKPFHQDAAHFAKTLASVSKLTGGIGGVAIGTDFGGVSPGEYNGITGIDSLASVRRILAEEYGMNGEEIEKIWSRNLRTRVVSALS